MLKQPSRKYAAFTPVNLINSPVERLRQRTWPTRTITSPPVWLSTDLRDGNQALIEPMDIARKLRLFRTLLDIGFKEIEVGFPAASDTEFSFVRYLIEHRLIPQDVTIQVLTPARETLIRRTFESLRGVDRAIVHVYNATAPNFRKIVFNLDKPGTLRLATQAASLIQQLADAQPETDWRFQYSPEVFTSTELPFARDICNAVLNVWQPVTTSKAIINLPASVEVSTPNIFADQVEWMHRHLNYREAVVLCVHPHNDRGCSIAAAELGQLAGAERVEGCLFGNGERTGNVDLVTLAMNLYTQGISPGLDFSNIDDIMRVTEDCTQIPVHPRHPYAGELVFTAFSGSHQDAIKKGFAAQKAAAANVADPDDIAWTVPYLPIDPADVGRSYESVVRVNSQSGKGGIAFLLEQDYGLSLPRKLQIELSQRVQKAVDVSGKEISADSIWDIFCQEYRQLTAPLTYVNHQTVSHQTVARDTHQIVLSLNLRYRNQPITLTGSGNGPIDAFVAVLNAMPELNHLGSIQIQHYEERSHTPGSNSKAVALVELVAQPSHALSRSPSRFAEEPHTSETSLGSTPSVHTSFGLGLHENIVIASFQAIVSALNRLECQVSKRCQTTASTVVRNATTSV